MAQNLELSELADIVSVNSSANGIILAAGVGVSANGSFGTSGQALTTNGSAVYWAPAFTNGQNIAVGTIVVNNQLIANGIFGTSGQILASDGSRVIWVDPSFVNVRQSFTGNGTNTQFTIVGGYTPNNLDVYVNGVKQAGADVTASSGNTIAFTVAPPNGSIIDVVGLAAFVAPSITGTANTSAQYTWTNTHTFNGLVSLTNVYANGVLGTAGQFLSTDGSKVYWSNGVSFVRQSYTADGNTQYTVTGGYTPSQIDVYINGVKQAGADITISSGTNVVFTVAPPTGAVIDVVGIANATLTYSTINTSAQYTWTNTQSFGAISANGSLGTLGQVLTSNGNGVFWSASGNGGGFVNGQSIIVNNFTITGNLTANGSNGILGQFLTTNGSSLYWSNAISYVRQSFTGDGNTSFTVSGGYTANQLDVYINGVKQTGVDITISSGSDVVFAVAPPTGAVIDVVGVAGAVLTYSTINTSAQYTWTNTQSFGAISANGSIGTAGQVLTSNGSSTYWSTGGAGFVNGQSITVNNFAITGPFTANGANGSLGQFLTTNGSAVYWSNGVSFVRQSYTADGNTQYTVTGGYTPNQVDVYINGVKQAGADITISSGTNVVFTVAPPTGAVIDVVGFSNAVLTYVTINTTAQYTWTNTQSFTAISANGSLGTAGQVLTSNGSSTYWSPGGAFNNGQSISVNNLIITGPFTANGSNGSAGQVLKSNGSATYWSDLGVSDVQYTWTNTHTFSNTVFLNALSANGSLGTAGQVLTSNGSDTYWAAPSGAASFIRQTITANGTASEYAISGGYTPNNLDVYINGVKQTGSEVAVSSGANIVFTAIPPSGAIIDVVGVVAANILYVATNSSAQYTWSDTQTFDSTIIIKGVSANGGVGSDGQFLTSNGTITYWASNANLTAVNAASFTVGSNLVANTSGIYHTGTVNAAILIGNVTATSVNVTTNTGLTLGSSSKTANGYSYLPNGLIFQWGTVDANSSVGNATFPIAFPTACQSVTVTGRSSTSNNFWLVSAANTTVAQIRSSVDSTAASVYYMAIGY